MRRTTFSEAPELEENMPPQRRQVLAGLKEETWPLLKSDSKTPASADTTAANTRQLIGDYIALERCCATDETTPCGCQQFRRTHNHPNRAGNQSHPGHGRYSKKHYRI